MFYSHEVLTSRKYGVATIWLVATLGSKSTLKKVSRKAILDVDVAKACETIATPEAPLALRLQSNLLYGVTRVYAQQCGYVLSDAETAKSNMRLLLNAAKPNSLDADGLNKARADQLLLQDDPNFLPDFDLVSTQLDQLNLNLTTLDSQNSTLSPHNSQPTVLSASSQEIGAFNIPYSASSLVGGPVGEYDIFGLREGSRTSARAGPKTLLDDGLGLDIDRDGNLVVSDAPTRPSQEAGPRGGSRPDSARSDPTLQGEPVRSLHDTAMIGRLDDDVFMPMVQGDPFGLEDQTVPALMSTAASQQVTSEETAEAPHQRRARPANKPIPIDHTMQLRSAELAHLSANYVANMKEAIRQRDANKAIAVAKKNAALWVMGTEEFHPLSLFTGTKLLEALTGLDVAASGSKRARDDDEANDEARRVRPRVQSSPRELGGGEQNDGFVPVADDDTIEQGREAPTPLDDRHLSSMMPWNQSAASRRPTGPFPGVGHPTSTASIGVYPVPASRRGSRLTSASPLMGRGDHGSSMGDLHMPGLGIDADMTGLDDFELFGPAAQVDTQTAGQSQWQRAILDGESLHFLEFVQSGIDELNEVTQQTLMTDERDDAVRGTIDFATLLPPASHTCIVAAQGLLHVLALGTNNLLSIYQDESYGPITLRTVEAV